MAGSKSSDPDLDPNASDSGDPPVGLSSSSSTTISAHNKPQKRSVHKSSGRKSGKLPHQDLPTLSRRLDYRLVPLDERPRHGNEVHLSGSAAGQILRPNNIVQTPTLGNTSVWVATAISGPVMGSLLRCPRFIKMAGWPTFEEVWVVKLERPSCKSFISVLKQTTCNETEPNRSRRLRSMGPRCRYRRLIWPYHRRGSPDPRCIYVTCVQDFR